MPGIVKGSAVSIGSPLIPFFYQEGGILKDPYALRYEIYGAGSSTKVQYGDVNMVTHKVGTGYYIAPVDTEKHDETLSIGPYEIVWYYKPLSTSAESTAAYRFEVLSPRYFRVGMPYVAYVGSDVDNLAEFTIEQRQQALSISSKEVERLTGRFFFPRYMVLKHSVKPDSTQLWLDQPIIGLAQITLEFVGVYTSAPTEYMLDNGSIRIFNRHLDFLFSPDDRDNPKISLVTVGETNDESAVSMGYFPSGARNVLITGVFGYTDPDGSPFGEVPRALQDVVASLAYKRLQDPLGTDILLSSPGRVKMAKTRDQQIQFDTSGTAGSSSSTMTGDPRLDDILLSFCRPAHVGVAG